MARPENSVLSFFPMKERQWGTSYYRVSPSRVWFNMRLLRTRCKDKNDDFMWQWEKKMRKIRSKRR